MYLSRIALNANLRKTMQAFASPRILHGAVEASFQDSVNEKRKRILWRIDRLKGVYYLLVLSEKQPDFSHIVEQFGHAGNAGQWETKNYSSLLERLKEDQVWQFRLRANPVRNSSMEKKQKTGRGKVFAHVTQIQQKQWLLNRAQTNGFLLTEDSFDVIHSEWKKFTKPGDNKHVVSLRVVDFEGLLTITDGECFRKTLLTGIGRGKAYGCGLLTIAHNKGEANG